MSETAYTPRERAALGLLAVVGFVGVNGAFLYGVLFTPDALGQALANPIALAFIVEAMILMIVLAWLLGRWGVSGMSFTAFVVLSLLGGLLFSLPVVLLARDGRQPESPSGQRSRS